MKKPSGLLRILVSRTGDYLTRTQPGQVTEPTQGAPPGAGTRWTAEEIAAGQPDLTRTNEELLFQTEALHGTAYDFQQFSLEKAGQGEGGAAFGFGVYLTSREDVARYYAEYVARRRTGEGKRILRTTVQHDNFLSWYEPPTDTQKLAILRKAADDRIFANQENMGYLLERFKLAIKQGTGEDAYKYLSMTLGSDQYASRFLQQAAIDGIQYPSGTMIGGKVARDTSRGWNYVVFDPSNVQIQEQMLFQGGPVDPMAEEAATFGTWTDFRDYVEAMYIPEERAATEEMTLEQKDAWYRRTWEEAKRQARQGEEVTQAEAARTDEQRDQDFLSSIQTDVGLRDFLRTLWEDAIDISSERQAEEFGLADEAEAAELARRREAAARTEREAHPLIHASAIAVGMDRELKPSTEKAIRTMIGKAPREYRRLLATISGDTEALAEIEKAAAGRPPITDPRWVQAAATGSIYDRLRLARQIRNEAIAKKIRRGDINLDEDTREYISSLNEQQAEARRKIEALQKEVAQSDKDFAGLSRVYEDQRAKLRTYQRELELVNRRIAGLVSQRSAVSTELLSRRERITREVDTLKRQISRRSTVLARA